MKKNKKKKKKIIIIIVLIFLIFILMLLPYLKKQFHFRINTIAGTTITLNTLVANNTTMSVMENNTKILQEAIDNNAPASTEESAQVTIQIPAGTYYFSPITNTSSTNCKNWVYSNGSYKEINVCTNNCKNKQCTVKENNDGKAHCHKNSETGACDSGAYYLVRPKSNIKIIGAGMDSTILKPYGAYYHGLDMFNYQGGNTVLYNVDFANFTIDGSSTSLDDNVVEFRDASGTVKTGWDGIGYKYDAKGKGFMMTPIENCDWDSVKVINTDGTGFGMDNTINCTIKNCVAIGCGKGATENDIGASGFGIGFGKNTRDSMYISNCLAIGNRKFGYFFEHQGRFYTDTTSYPARSSTGFVVENSIARGNMYDYGGEMANDVSYINVLSEPNTAGPNPLGNSNSSAFYFGTSSKRITIINPTINYKFSGVETESSATWFYNALYWALRYNIVDGGQRNNIFSSNDYIGKGAAIELIWRYKGRPGDVLLGTEQLKLKSTYNFNDLEDIVWSSATGNKSFYNALVWAADKGIVSKNQTFNASKLAKINFLVMLHRLYKNIDAKDSSLNGNTLSVGSDNFSGQEICGQSGDQAYPQALNWAVNNKIISKPSNIGSLCLDDSMYMKAEIISMLYNYNKALNEHTVTYDFKTNGGTQSTQTKKVLKNDAIDLNVSATKSGYKFVGWNTNQNAKEGLKSLNMQTSDVKLYAIYKKDAVTLSANFNKNGANLSSTNSKSCTLNEVYNNETQATSCTITAPTITRSGFEIVGYNTNSFSTVSNSSYNKNNNTITLTSSNTNQTWYAITKKEVIGNFYYYNGSTQQLKNDSCTIYNSSDSCDFETPADILSSNGPDSSHYLGLSTEPMSTLIIIQPSSKYTNYYAIYQGTWKATYKKGTGVSAIGEESNTCQSTKLSDGSKYVSQNCNVTLPSITAQSGYKVLGWYNSSDSKVGSEQASYSLSKNETLTAKASNNLHKVTYNYTTNGGNNVSKENETYEEGESINLKVTAEKKDYTFVGWNIKPAAKEGLDSLKMGPRDIVLYAIFKKEAVTLNASFNANGATLSSTSSKSCTLDEVYNNETQATSCTISAPTITRQGYTIIGYNTTANSKSNNNSYNSSTKKITLTNSNSNQTWYAITKKETSGTFYYYNGKDQSYEITNCTLYNTDSTCNYTLPSSVQNSVGPNNATYSGVSISPNSTTQASVYTNTNQNYYAIYKGKWTLNYKKGAGVETIGAESAYCDNYKLSDGIKYTNLDCSIQLPTITVKNNYRVDGWYDSKNIRVGGQQETVKIKNDDTLTATAIDEGSYLVTYDYATNGGTTATTTGIRKKQGEEADLNVKAEKKGYTFVGWNTNPNAKEKITSYKVNNDVTLYAIFKKDLNIEFIDYKGTTKTSQQKKITIYNKEKGTLIAPALNTYSGWEGIYWTKSNQPTGEKAIGANETITDIVENAVYYGRYSKTIKIEFDLNGGSGIKIPTQTKIVNTNSNNISNISVDKVKMPIISALKEGYNFLGWNTNSTGTGIDYREEEEVAFSNSTILYIRWIKKNSTPIEPTTPSSKPSSTPKPTTPSTSTPKPSTPSTQPTPSTSTPSNNAPSVETAFDQSHLNLEIDNKKWVNDSIELKLIPEEDSKNIKSLKVNDKEVKENKGYTYIFEENGTYIIEIEDKTGIKIKKQLEIKNIDKTNPKITNIKKETIESNEYIDLIISLEDNISGIKKVEYSYDGNNWINSLTSQEIGYEVTDYNFQVGTSRIKMRWTKEINTDVYIIATDNAGLTSEVKKIKVEHKQQEEPIIKENNNLLKIGIIVGIIIIILIVIIIIKKSIKKRKN